MREILFTIGPLKVYGYGAMIAVGVVLAFITAGYREKKMVRFNGDFSFDLSLWSLIGGLIGAKILFWITEWKEIAADPLFILTTITSGFVVYGGLIGGILTAILYSRFRGQHFLNYFDLLMPSVALGQAFGRLGCFMAGCCYGARTDAFWGIVFTSSSYAPNGVKLIPTQLISSAADLLNFAVLSIILKKSKKEGMTGGAFLIFYSIGRFLIEFLRDDPRGSVGILSTSQFIAIFILAAGLLLFGYSAAKGNPVAEAAEEETAEETETAADETEEKISEETSGENDEVSEEN